MTDINALQLDEFVSLPPEFRGQIEAEVPAWYKDQMGAASSDTEELTAWITKGKGQNCEVNFSDIDDWMRLGLLDTMAQWLNGKARTCIHDPNPMRPEPVLMAAWKPGLVVCVSCSPLLKIFGDADKTCDCCGHICAGPENNDSMRVMTLRNGAVIYQAGVCQGCRFKFDKGENHDST